MYTLNTIKYFEIEIEIQTKILKSSEIIKIFILKIIKNYMII